MSRYIPPFADVGQGITPFDGALLYFYESGTSTPLDTFYNDDMAPGHENANPVVADANGLLSDIFIQDLPYRVVLKDKNGVQQWLADPVENEASASVSAATVAAYTASATYYVDSGTANAYVLTQPQGLSTPLITSGDYPEGALIRFVPDNASSAASTLTLAGGAAYAIRTNADADLTDELAADGTEYYLSYRAAFNSGAGAWSLNTLAAGTVAIDAYEPSGTAYTAAGARYTFAHGLGAVPDVVTITMTCTATDGNFAIGNKIEVASLSS